MGLQWDTIMDKLMVDTKKFDNSMTAATKKASSNHNCFVVLPTWISYFYYSEDETFSSKLVDPGKKMG